METIRHKFVEAIPNELEAGVIYISGSRRTATHLCVCGCGNEVTTPISPTDWQLKFNGESISLTPSIGLWEFKCRSHYWIIKNQIRHSGSWNDREVQQGREREKQRRVSFYNKEVALNNNTPVAPEMKESLRPKGWFRSFLDFLRI
jgi:hypothetical protein